MPPVVGAHTQTRRHRGRRRTTSIVDQIHQRAAHVESWGGGTRRELVPPTHRLITADRMDLGPEHDGREDQKEETLEAEEDEEDDSCWWRKITALWREEEHRRSQ